MLPLEDPKWSSFEGGYRIPYDASIPLLRLEKASSAEEINSLYAELWQELHHQGDVGLASYFAVPHLIRIAKEKRLLDYNMFGLIATIEIERRSDNPELPEEYRELYLDSIRKGIPELVKLCLEDNWDLTLSSAILSALAVSKGQIELGQVITKMEDMDLAREFLENY